MHEENLGFSQDPDFWLGFGTQKRSDTNRSARTLSSLYEGRYDLADVCQQASDKRLDGSNIFLAAPSGGLADD